MAIDHPDRHKVSAVHDRIVVGLLWIGFCARALPILSQGLWRDEVDQWRFAYFSLDELLGNLTRPGWNGPLYSLLLRAWIAATGNTVYSMRYLSVLFGVLSISTAYVLGRLLIGRRHAVTVALLVAVSPYMVWYAQEIKMYTWVPFLVMLALYGTTQGAETGRGRWWWLVFFVTTLAVYSHILAALLIPVLVLWFWLHPRRAPGAWVGGLLTLAGLSLPYLPLLRWQAALAFVPRETGFPERSLGQMAAALLNGWSMGISQGTWGTRLGLALGMSVAGVVAVLGFVALFARRASVALRLVVWLAVPLLGIWLVSLWSPIFTDRYLIWSVPAFYALVAAGLGRLGRPLGLIGLGILLAYSVHGLAVQATDPIKPQFEQAADYVTRMRGPDDLLLFQIPYNRLVYEVYAGDALGVWAEAPFTNWREPDGSYRVNGTYVARELAGLVGGYDRVWLVYSEVALWDDRELVKGWLDIAMEGLDQQHYPGVSVYLYGRRTP